MALITYDHNVAVWRLRPKGPPLSVVLPVNGQMPSPVAAAANLHNLTEAAERMAALLQAPPRGSSTRPPPPAPAPPQCTKRLRSTTHVR